MLDFSAARRHLLSRIKLACQPGQNVQLLAVSKTQSVANILALHAAGQMSFGENYLQEALLKITALQKEKIEWHFIGHVQRNKTKEIARHFDWVHGVDRLLVAERLAVHRPTNTPPLNICLQVNIDNALSKHGCTPEELPSLVAHISQLPNLQLRGLMIIPTEGNSASFTEAKQLFDRVQPQHAAPHMWNTLSMGMSADLETAIAAGSTLVRVGRDLFGERK